MLRSTYLRTRHGERGVGEPDLQSMNPRLLRLGSIGMSGRYKDTYRDREECGGGGG